MIDKELFQKYIVLHKSLERPIYIPDVQVFFSIDEIISEDESLLDWMPRVRCIHIDPEGYGVKVDEQLKNLRFGLYYLVNDYPSPSWIGKRLRKVIQEIDLRDTNTTCFGLSTPGNQSRE